MYNASINITIVQVPSKAYANRNKTISFDFCEAFNWKTSCKNMTDKGSITFPKNLFYKDENGQSKPFNGDRVNVGGFNSAPLFLRGDKVELKAGYSYVNTSGAQITETATIIDGYISKVNAGVPIQLEVEDNMWVLKQVPLTNRTFESGTSLESILSWVVETANKSNALKKTNTQFVFISHNKITMEIAHQLIGVTMQEQGVSRIVAVDLEAAATMVEAA